MRPETGVPLLFILFVDLLFSQIEFCECEGCSLLAVTLTWDKAMMWPLTKALENALTVMQTVRIHDRVGVHL